AQALGGFQPALHPAETAPGLDLMSQHAFSEDLLAISYDTDTALAAEPPPGAEVVGQLQCVHIHRVAPPEPDPQLAKRVVHIGDPRKSVMTLKKGAIVGKHELHPSAGPEHADRFGQHEMGVLSVLQHGRRENQVEMAVREGQVLALSIYDNGGIESVAGEDLAGEFPACVKAAGGRFDAVAFHTVVAAHDGQEDSEPAADFEQALAAKLGRY